MEKTSGPWRILLVEDEMLVAMLLEDMLVEAGHTIVGPMARIDQAVEAARSEAIDLAILDVNVGGEEVYPVAEALASREIPFAFATGYGAHGLAEPWQDRPTLQKPFHRSDLFRMVAELASSYSC
ncbi:MAG TPA: response regulator [Frateuria sp.]|uniref:response regulator n=1 Tax=Frateuria sp. TaxID=2211372 RepID=UPI002D7F4349|nr:response regulator [Frateuria sp.]HET6804519.1 response regulator [Frateuria sp.]